MYQVCTRLISRRIQYEGIPNNVLVREFNVFSVTSFTLYLCILVLSFDVPVCENTRLFYEFKFQNYITPVSPLKLDYGRLCAT
jgi:hypothetical protein